MMAKADEGAAATEQELRQQLEALKAEAQALEPLLEELFPELFPPKFVSEELAAAGGMAAGLLAAYKLLRIVPLNEAVFTHLRHGMIAAASIYIGWRLASGCVSRLVSAISSHRRRRKAAMRKWAALLERIERVQKLVGALAPDAPTPHQPAGAAAQRAQPQQQQPQQQPQQQQQQPPPLVGTPPPPALPVSAGAAAASPPAPGAGAAAGAVAAVASAVMSLDRRSTAESSVREALPGAEVEGAVSSMDTDGGHEAAAQQPQQQQPRTSWSSGLAGWSQLYSSRPSAGPVPLPPQQLQLPQLHAAPPHAPPEGAAGGAVAGAPWPGGSPVLLQTPWDNGASTDDEEEDGEWEQPTFAASAAAGTPQGRERAGGSGAGGRGAGR